MCVSNEMSRHPRRASIKGATQRSVRRMKRHSNAAIKAHFIRGAFYLLPLFAVCVVPFALAQQNGKGSAANSKLTTTMKLAGAEAQPPALTSLVGGPHKPSAGESVLPYGLRPSPDGGIPAPTPTASPTCSPGSAGPWVMGNPYPTPRLPIRGFAPRLPRSFTRLLERGGCQRTL